MSQDLICSMKYTEQNLQGIRVGTEGNLITGTMTGINHTGDVEIIRTGVMAKTSKKGRKFFVNCFTSDTRGSGLQFFNF